MVYDASLLAAAHARDMSHSDVNHPEHNAKHDNQNDHSSHLNKSDQGATPNAAKEFNSARTDNSNHQQQDGNTSNFLKLHDFSTFRQQPVQLVFIDSRVQDPQALLKGISPNAEVHFLDPNKDGVAQINSIIAREKAPIAGIYILSHGSSGSLELGSSELNSTTLETTYAQEISSWGSHLTTNANILLFGCDVAAGTTGRQFVTELSDLTHVAVAGAIGEVGSSALGGSWDLEYDSGVVTLNASDIFSGTALSNYGFVLGQPTLDLNGSNANYNTSFSEQTLTPVAIASNVEIADPNGQLITGATVTLSNFQTGDTLVMGTLPSTIKSSINNNTGVLTLTSKAAGGASTSDFQTALQDITYKHTGASPTATRTVVANVTVTDASSITSNTSTSYIDVIPYNTSTKVPLITSSSYFSVVEGTSVSTPVFTVAAHDNPSVPITYSLSGTDASYFNINASTGAVTLKAVSDYQTKNSYSINVVAADTYGNTTQAISVAVTDVAPTITSSASFTVVEGTAISTPVLQQPRPMS